MRAYLARVATRVRSVANAGTLALVIAITAVAFHISGEPPRTLVDGHGQTYQPVQAVVNLWVQLAIMVVSALISYALSPKPPKPKPAALEEFDIPQSREGQPFSWIFGECYVPDATVAYWGNFTSSPIKSKSGKK